MNTKYWFLIIFTISVISGCEKFADHKYGIRIDNNSGQVISVYADYILPDTSLALEKPQLRDVQIGCSEDIYDYEVGDGQFERLKTQKITVFILSHDTVQQYTWSEIKNNYKILKRYEFNQNELTAMGGAVVFP